MKYIIRPYRIEPGALEVQYIEEDFEEFQGRKKMVAEIMARLQDREHLILLSMAPSPDGDDHLVPVSFKVGHELRSEETDPGLAELVSELKDHITFANRKIFYSWIGGTRRQWRGQHHYRALTEQQEEWALRNGYHEIVVKTKNKFYAMRATLDHLRFNVIKFGRNPDDNFESKVYLSKIIKAELLRQHRTERMMVETV
jgi:hypothetical protein